MFRNGTDAHVNINSKLTKFNLFCYSHIKSIIEWRTVWAHRVPVVCTVDLGTCNCFEMAPSDFFKTIMSSFRSALSSLDFPIVVFVAESNRYIKQALLKWAQKSHLLLLIRITQKNLRSHATKNI